MTVLAEESTNPDCPVLIADRINTLRAHRADVFTSMKTVGIRVVVMWELSVKDAIARIKERKFGHKTIGPDANVGMIVGRTAKEFQPLQADEIGIYNIRKVIVIRDAICLSREQIVKTVLMELSEIPELKPLELERITDEDINRALSQTMEREKSISIANKVASTKQNHTSTRASNRAQIREGRYEIGLENSPSFSSIIPDELVDSSFIRKSELHVTLLFINRKLAKMLNEANDDENENARIILRAIEFYKSSFSKPIDVKVEYIARNTRVMAAKVSLKDSGIKYFDVIPHITIAKTHSAQSREANDLIGKCDSLRKNQLPQGTEGIYWIDVSDDLRVTGHVKFTKHGNS
jgi:hypothetical protein